MTSRKISSAYDSTGIGKEIYDLYKSTGGDKKIIYKFIEERIPNLSKEDLTQISLLIWVMDIEIYQLLYDAGADMRANNDQLFIKSCSHSDNNFMKFFLDIGSDPNAQGGKGLVGACGENYLENVIILVEHGCKITNEAIDISIAYTNTDIIKYLLENDADPNYMMTRIFKSTSVGCNDTDEEGFDILKMISKYEPNYEKVINDL